MTDPIRKTLSVPLPPQEAFDLFTDGIDLWWPKEGHSAAAREGRGAEARVRVEPRRGGRVIETLPGGREVPWATVRVWEPGRRLALDWHPGRDEDEATEVEVTFTRTDAGTRVDLVHGGFDRPSERATTAMAGFDAGWSQVLCRRYAARCHQLCPA
jgi:uncharacterized protein YndB with AHSA1/START domain